ncbi:aminoacyl-tRNA hydrolase [Candidatus Brocadia sapporoensis]|uniref:Peptidyl-tRNA hydrolase n=1 Tax=Candidatus Brocadia sapporoensis TaxID=392547 RepID=A0A1V6LZN3_9BACT|nr:aminoacyl-tRNA hydrolase [Candidatus Brocadia sapporoensis]OQD45618.1 aminoacyl-tRNA hydrolase [Candidatus Brocadia sapporoensis]GJQ24832.1 MAG: peptidyl-tRNA hydrolase [Candidatus Brocadia sapporoensis]
MKIIVGLGNPGEKYLKTRHNFGFMAIDRFAWQLETACNQKKFHSLFCKEIIEGEEVVLLKPQTFMNMSGVAVQEALAFYKCALQDLMVVGDDLDLPLGKIRIRRNGGFGGHRGLESIANSLGTMDFPRLRMGIGRSASGNISNYVLYPFSEDEELVVQEVIEKVCRVLKTWIFEGIETCMNQFN